MTPHLFECMVFLKFNRGLWDLQTVAQAMKEVRSDRVATQLAEDGEHSDGSEVKEVLGHRSFGWDGRPTG